MLSGEGSFFLFLSVKCFHHESVLILSSTFSSPIEISITSDMQMTPLLWHKVKRNSKAS